MSDFIHLHNHSHYSLQDGACTIDGLIEAALENNMQSVALTDHGVMYGIAEFYRKAVAKGIKPIVGMEAYIVKEGSRFERGTGDETNGRKKSKHYNHLILLAKNNEGYKSLSKLSTLGHTEGFYYKPRIDLELLRKYRDGLICTSACAGGVVSSHLVSGNIDKAREVAKTYKDIFEDDFYLEIQDHGMDIDKPILEWMPKFSKELGIKLVATNDCHYIKKDHAIAHNILLLLSDKNGADYNHLRYGTDQVYFKSSDEMIRLFKNHISAIENTLEIDSKINLKLDFEGHHFPRFPIPEDKKASSLDDYFELLAREGLSNCGIEITPEVEERFNFEINTIKEMGFAGYFLIVQDFINAAKKNKIPVGPGRGSVAGSLVAFALGITNINPLSYNLLFERFLNPARKSMPDIDVDFADDKRSDVIEYVRNKYGEKSVSQIITFNRLSSKAVIRDVARVLKIPIPTVNKITKYIPSKFGKVFTIDKALNEVQELQWVKNSDDKEIQDLIRYAKVLEGMNRNASKHAAGVVITPGDVSDYVPLANAVSQQDIVTQFNMKEIERAGLLKMDFLGLRTLTIIRDTLDLIKKNHGIEIDIDQIPIDNTNTYKLFAKGQTTGVFQFESAPMREYLKKLNPSSLNDLAAMNALYRPGPMDFINDFIDRKFGRKKVEYLHPLLEPILKETYGIIVYQEQVIQIANKIAGMSLAQADLLRRAMGKKDLQAMKQQKVKFVEGAVSKNISKKIAEKIYDAIDKFANYGFNKSHAVAYSYIAYQTAYLKNYYTAEFLAANLTNEFGNTDKVTKFLEDCRKLKIEVLPPDVNHPTVNFDVVNNKIRFGMSAIKNVGKNAVEEIIRTREKLDRDFTSIFDFCMHVDTRVVNKRALEGLVLAGAFDSIDKRRATLFEAIEYALEFGHKAQNSKLVSSNSLFDDTDEIQISEPELRKTESWSEKERLKREREVIGFYVTGHPLQKYETEYYSFSDFRLGETEGLNDMSNVRACGIITELRTKIDRSGKRMAFFTIDDFSGSCECLMFSKIYSEYGKFVKEEEPVFILGNVESSGDAVKLHVNKVLPIESARNELIQSVKIMIDREKNSIEQVAELKNILDKYEGKTPVFIHLNNNGSREKLYSLDRYRISVSEKLINDIKTLLGNDSILLNSK
ncbi:DNA polymerase III subunit alpha [bacterium BMS3Abin03]|nr:DNA polymerase III subunit alpha [bacterium BMS3Abin03]MCG6959900.1 DNA polymerase III subunit alpha [bacterium BMS3Abin03]